MVHPVSLSNPAFEALRREKRAGESDSDVVLRLTSQARETRDKNLDAWLRYKPKRWLTPEAHLFMIKELDELDTIDKR